MGWSRGAVAAVYSSSARFTKMYSPTTGRFAAHIGVYTPCRYQYRDDDKTTGAPIRLFHGAADDITPVEVCRSYAARVKASGGDVTLTEYPGAYHLFDNPLQGPPGVQDPQQQNQRNCLIREDQEGRLRNAKTNQLFDVNTDPCVVRGGTRGFNEAATIAVMADVKGLLATVLKR
jgi:dienelactone hydrolase